MARIGLTRIMACAALMMVTSMVCANVTAPKNSESKPTQPVPANVGTFNEAKVYAAYWRTVQYNDSVEKFNTDLRKLGDKPETDELTIRRAKLTVASRNLNASFKRDLAEAIQVVVKNHHVMIVIHGQVIYKAEGVKTIELTDPLIALIDQEPKEKQP